MDGQTEVSFAADLFLEIENLGIFKSAATASSMIPVMTKTIGIGI